jgi:O-acetyl-ADP-ribose deacetylase (regulator of RNase III)
MASAHALDGGGSSRRGSGEAGSRSSMDITLVLGDITEQHVDAIVNAANSSLLGGGGVDGAIHRRGGPEILAECRQLRAERYRDGLPAGQAVATPAGRLPARWVIHTAGPVYSAAEDRSGILASCYRESLRVARELGARTVAFPAVSAGIYGWPADSAARIAVTAVRQFAAAAGQAPERAIREVRFVLFTRDVYAAFERALATDTADGVTADG